MNNQLQQYARNNIKEGLKKLPENWQMMFKRMYSHDNLNKAIEDVVDNIPEDKLDWALSQIQNSLKKANVA